MNRKLIIDGNAVYEVDEDCMLGKRVEEEKGNENRDVQKDAYIEDYKKALRRTEN